MLAAASPRSGRRIAIVRFTSLGDVVHTLPVADAIRRHDPTARISWLVEEHEQILLRDNAIVDDVVIVPLRRWRKQLLGTAGCAVIRADWRALRGTLRDLKVDVAIDVQGWGHKTSPFVSLTRAPMRVGFDRRYARDPLSTLFTTVHVTPPATAKHVVDLNLALLGPLGITAPGDARFPLPPFADAETRAAAWFRDHDLRAPRIVALLPSTRGTQKIWPADRYQELARRLLKDDAMSILVLGGPGEEDRLESVRGDLPAGRVTTWAGGPVPDLTAILRRVDLVVGNDTGPLHLAAAHDVPALGLFGPTRGERNGPYGRLGAFVQSTTGKMPDISIDEVESAVRALSARAGAATFRVTRR
jgi:heptosyltransferase I